MFEHVGYEDLECATFYGAIAEVVSEPLVAELAQSFDDIAMLHEPIVRVAGALPPFTVLALLAGRHRVAAHVVRDLPTVRCKLVVCDDETARDITEHEEVYRKHDPERRRQVIQEMLARMSVLPDRDPPKRRGRPPSAESIARAEIAKATGASPEAVRYQQRKARQQRPRKGSPREGVDPLDEALGVAETDLPPPDVMNGYADQFPGNDYPEPEIPPETLKRALEVARVAKDALHDAMDAAAGVDTRERPAEACIDTLGLELDPGFLASVAAIQTALDAAARHLSAAQGVLTGLERDEALPADKRTVGACKAEIKGMGVRLRGMRPGALCYWCKGQDGYQDDCSACQGRGYVTEQQMDTAPAMLRVTGAKAVVMKQGKAILLSTVLAEVEADEEIGGVP